MVCLGIEPGVAGRKAWMNPLSYGGTPVVAQLVDTKDPRFESSQRQILSFFDQLY